MKRNRALIGTIAASAMAATTMLAGGTTATAGTLKDPIVEGLMGPLQFSFNSADRPLVAENFGPGTISRIKNGNKFPVVQDDGTISGVDQRKGVIAYTLSGGAMQRESKRALGRSLRGGVEGFALLKMQGPKGNKKVLANLLQAETNRNPDSHQAYGWFGYQEQCSEPAPAGNEPRDGIVESNPHSVAAAPGGGWYVADAAANVVWKVKNGKIRVVKVFKPRNVVITEQIADMNELPECAIGTRYKFEPVPTDVEVGPGGALYVSLLPGEGAEGAPFVPGTGAVERVNPATGQSRVVARGFTGTTNVALARNKIFVAELFAGQVTQVNMRTGVTKPVVYLPLPAALEQHKGKLYVTYDIFPEGEMDPPNGKLAVIDPSGPPPAPPVIG